MAATGRVGMPHHQGPSLNPTYDFPGPDHGHFQQLQQQDLYHPDYESLSTTHHIYAPAPIRRPTGKFTEEWDASQRGSSILNGPLPQTRRNNANMSSIQRSNSFSGSTAGDGQVPSRGNTLKKKPSLRRSGSLKRSGSRRSRSRSASTPGTHLCHIRECPRGVAGEGFSRRPNLLRHMRLVHGLQEGDAPLPADVDSEDEMLGGVHRDGFLKPVKIRPGWRSADLAAEPRKRRRMRKDDPEETDGDRVSSA